MAGSYVVAATSRGLVSGLAGVENRPPTDKPERDYVMTYFPNSLDAAGAMRVQVGVGAEARGTDIRLARVNTVRVRGKVSGAPQGAQVMVVLMPKGMGALGLVGGRTARVQQKDGELRYQGRGPRIVRAELDHLRPAGRACHGAPLQVGEQHVEGVVLQLGGGGELPGTMVAEGQAPLNLSSVQVLLQSRDSISLSPPRGPVGEGGKFTLKNVSPARYFVQVLNVPEGSYVKSVQLGAEEVPEEGLDLSNGVAGSLQITLSPAGAQVDGRIQNQEDRPVSGATVVLIPDSRRYSLYKEVNSRPERRLQLQRCRAGRIQSVSPGKTSNQARIRILSS